MSYKIVAEHALTILSRATVVVADVPAVLKIQSMLVGIARGELVVAAARPEAPTTPPEGPAALNGANGGDHGAVQQDGGA